MEWWIRLKILLLTIGDVIQTSQWTHHITQKDDLLSCGGVMVNLEWVNIFRENTILKNSLHFWNRSAKFVAYKQAWAELNEVYDYICKLNII